MLLSLKKYENRQVMRKTLPAYHQICRCPYEDRTRVLPFYDILPPTAEYLLNMRQWRRNVRNFGETGVIDRTRRDDRLPRD